jgi:hypothetical protein
VVSNWLETYNSTNHNEKLAIDQSYFEEGRRTHGIKIIGLESAGSQNERKSESHLEKDEKLSSFGLLRSE